METNPVGRAARIVAIASLALGVSQSAASRGDFENDFFNDDPIAAERKTADALVVRPVGIAATVLGSVVYVISLPFSYFGGNQPEAYRELVVEPAEHTFGRPLGEDF